MLNQLIEYSPEVTEAIKNRQPIVALESTIISHGMPYPQNIDTAKEYLESMDFKYYEKYGVKYLSTRVIEGVMENYAMYKKLSEDE